MQAPKIDSERHIETSPTAYNYPGTTIRRLIHSGWCHVLIKPDNDLAPALRAIKHVLGTLFPTTLSRPKSNANLNFYFGNRAFKKALKAHCIWKTAPNAVGMSFDSTLPSTSPDTDQQPQSDYQPCTKSTHFGLPQSRTAYVNPPQSLSCYPRSPWHAE